MNMQYSTSPAIQHGYAAQQPNAMAVSSGDPYRYNMWDAAPSGGMLQHAAPTNMAQYHNQQAQNVNLGAVHSGQMGQGFPNMSSGATGMGMGQNAPAAQHLQPMTMGQNGQTAGAMDMGQNVYPPGRMNMGQNGQAAPMNMGQIGQGENMPPGAMNAMNMGQIGQGENMPPGAMNQQAAQHATPQGPIQKFQNPDYIWISHVKSDQDMIGALRKVVPLVGGYAHNDIEECGTFICAISERYFSDQTCLDELKYALSCKKKLVLVHKRNAPLAQIFNAAAQKGFRNIQNIESIELIVEPTKYAEVSARKINVKCGFQVAAFT